MSSLPSPSTLFGVISYNALRPRSLSLEDWRALLTGVRTPVHRFDAMEWIGDSVLRFLTRYALLTLEPEAAGEPERKQKQKQKKTHKTKDGARSDPDAEVVGTLDHKSVAWLSNAGMEALLQRQVPTWQWTADMLERVVGWAWTIRDWPLLAALFRQLQWIQPRVVCDRVVPSLVETMNSLDNQDKTVVRRDGRVGLPLTVRARLLASPVWTMQEERKANTNTNTKWTPGRSLYHTRPTESAWVKCGDWSLVLGHAFAQPWHLVECLTLVGKNVPAIDIRTGATTRVRTQSNSRLSFLGDGLLNLLAIEDRARALMDRERTVAAIQSVYPHAAARILAEYAAPDLTPGMATLSLQVSYLRSNKLWSRIGLARHVPLLWFQASRELEQSYHTSLATVVSMIRDIREADGAATLLKPETVQTLCTRMLERMPLPKEYADVMEASFGAVFLDMMGTLCSTPVCTLRTMGQAFDDILARVWPHVGGQDIILKPDTSDASLVRRLVRRRLDPLDREVLLRATAPPASSSASCRDAKDEDEVEVDEYGGISIVC
jgi:hypothetical protein